MLRLDWRNYSDRYIVLKEKIDFIANDSHEDSKAKKNIRFRNNAPFRSGISKITNQLIDIAEDLDMVIPKYNLLEYSNN